uniref:Putative secreted protein n=1 Tax=Panstrongylus lignarius TaxID=156445 RepID=A0A224XSX6_9HEMI
MEFLVLLASLGTGGASGLHGGVRNEAGKLGHPTAWSNRALTQTKYSVPGRRSSILQDNASPVYIDLYFPSLPLSLNSTS